MKRKGFVPFQREGWPETINPEKIKRETAHYKVLDLSKETLIWVSEHGGERHVHKLYFGRGPISWLREHLFAFRVEREYLALDYLAKRGVPCSHPVSWTKGFSPELGGRVEVLSTVEVKNAISLDDIWKHPELTLSQKQQYLCESMVLIRRMHEAGLHHGAMYIRNILFEQEADELKAPRIIDVPRAIACYHCLVGDPLATIDLLQFFEPVAEALGETGLKEALTAYGLNAQEQQVFLQKLKHYRPTKHTRNKERAYGTWRSLFAKNSKQKSVV